MNVMAQAHKATKAYFAANASDLTYRIVFVIELKSAHKEYKTMNDVNAVALLKAETIAKFEQRILELNEAGAQYGTKWIIVCGDDHPMPVNFHASNPKWPWCKVEHATMWSMQWAAEDKAKLVVNGNGQAGKAMLVDDHIAWDIANLEKLVKELKAEK